MQNKETTPRNDIKAQARPKTQGRPKLKATTNQKSSKIQEAETLQVHRKLIYKAGVSCG